MLQRSSSSSYEVLSGLRLCACVLESVEGTPSFQAPLACTLLVLVLAFDVEPASSSDKEG